MRSATRLFRNSDASVCEASAREDGTKQRRGASFTGNGSGFLAPAIDKLHSRLALPLSALDIGKKARRKLLEAGFSSVLDLVLTYPDSVRMEAAKLTPKQMSRIRSALGDLNLIQGRELDISVIDAAKEQIMINGG